MGKQEFDEPQLSRWQRFWQTKAENWDTFTSPEQRKLADELVPQIQAVIDAFDALGLVVSFFPARSAQTEDDGEVEREFLGDYIVDKLIEDSLEHRVDFEEEVVTRAKISAQDGYDLIHKQQEQRFLLKVVVLKVMEGQRPLYKNGFSLLMRPRKLEFLTKAVPSLKSFLESAEVRERIQRYHHSEQYLLDFIDFHFRQKYHGQKILRPAFLYNPKVIETYNYLINEADARRWPHEKYKQELQELFRKYNIVK